MVLLLCVALADPAASAVRGQPPVGEAPPAARAPSAKAAVDDAARAAPRPRRPCPSCDRRAAFEAAVATRDFPAADALVAGMLEDGDNTAVAEYWIHARGRCAEALRLLDPVRRAWNPRISSAEQSAVTSALVCEAARLESGNPAASDALLVEALDKDMGTETLSRQPELYLDFARRALMNEDAMRFLRRRQLDNDRSGYAIEAQIGRGSVYNVGRLLALGLNPNEFHGVQHAALGEALELLSAEPDLALQIVDVLLAGGADPAMLVDFGPDAWSKPAPPEARARFDARIREANAELSRTMPVRIDFYDFETMGARSRQPAYARFYVFNRSGADVVLDSWYADGGVEVAGEGASFEFRLMHGAAWIPYSYDDNRVPHAKGKRRLLQDGERTMLYVPIDFHPLASAPPGLQLRLRIPSASGRDYLSTPFSLHDGRLVRAAWPYDPATKTVYYSEGKKIPLPDGMPTLRKGPTLAPHSHAPQETGGR